MEKIIKKLAELPDVPGIYLFYNKKDVLVYVGKATSLKSRVRSYWRGLRSPRPIEEMIHEVVDLETKQTDSALEAAILESIVIKKYQPRYNVMGKDDKSWNYLVITKEQFPQLTSIRQHDYESLEHENTRTPEQFKYMFGPFPGLNTKATLTLLRKMFRYSTCKPPTTVISTPSVAEGEKSGSPKLKPDSSSAFGLARNDKRTIGRPCFYREIDQCLGVCTGEITAKEYNVRVIKPLVLFLSGKKKQVIALFESQMKAASKAEDYETAARLRDQIRDLKRIHDMSILNDSFFKDPNLILEGPTSVRVEGYDISNLGATEKVGSMVVFGTSGPKKSDYRKFKIKTVPGQSDIDSLKEMLERRLNHSEWPLPTLFLIDGGTPQVNAALSVFKKRGINVPIVGVAKGPKRKRNDILPEISHLEFGAQGCVFPNKEVLFRWVNAHIKLLVAVRDEAHRFAITFHRTRRGKQLLA